jgi:uncharacterized membrane-anchored protein YhcB (DUF1043 family)
MEVHHPHHANHKKKWSELLLEFFMLFLAVTLGFFAENIRETIAEKHKKEEQLEAVVRDFKTDLSEIQRHRNLIKWRYNNCNEFVKILDSDYRKIKKVDFYRMALWHAESKDLVLNEKTRIDAESKGYFTNDGISELSGILNKFNYYYTDYKELNQGILEFCKLYIKDIIPEFMDPHLSNKSDFVWTPNPTTTDPDFQGYLERPIDQKIKNKIMFNIINKRQLIMIELSDIDSLEKYANKAIEKINSQNKE